MLMHAVYPQFCIAEQFKIIITAASEEQFVALASLIIFCGPIIDEHPFSAILILAVVDLHPGQTGQVASELGFVNPAVQHLKGTGAYLPDPLLFSFVAFSDGDRSQSCGNADE